MKSSKFAMIALIAVSLIGASLSNATYWTVPVDYYNDWSYTRYALDDAVNTYNRGTSTSSSPLSYFNSPSIINDADREYVTHFQATFDPGMVPQYASIDYEAYVPPTGADEHAASLSIWVRPTDASSKEVIASRGTVQSGGFILAKTGANGLSFTFYAQNTSQDVYIASVLASGSNDAPLFEDNKWANIIVTQTTSSSEDDGGPYVAIYVNGYLRGNANYAFDEYAFSGILGDFSSDDNLAGAIGYISNAGESFVLNLCGQNYFGPAEGNCFRYVERTDIDQAGYYSEYATFFSGRMSDFRWFLGINLVCVSKTSYDYQQPNRTDVEVGDLCDIASDIASIGTDRLEWPNVLGRMPFRVDSEDKNWEGLGQASSRTNSKEPQFVSDALRYSVALFDEDYINYNMHRDNFVAAGVSVWVSFPGDYMVGSQLIFNLDGQAGGIDVSVSNTAIKAFDYTSKSEVSANIDLSDGTWHHIAVSLDGPRSDVNDDAQTKVAIYVDGELLIASSKFPFLGDVTNGDFGVAGGINSNSTEMKISDVLVTDSPITLPQVKRLSTRWPGGAYQPIYPKANIDARYVNTESGGYTYRQVASRVRRDFEAGSAIYDSISMAFTYDWSKPGTVWNGFDDSGDSDSGECQFVLGGMAVLGDQERGAWDVADSHSVLLCFTPSKIEDGVNPFTVLLTYRAYDNAMYFLPLLDVPLTSSALSALQKYSDSSGVAGMTSKIELNVGPYNIFIQVKSSTSESVYTPNYIVAMYFGANALVSSFLNDDDAVGIQPVFGGTPMAGSGPIIGLSQRTRNVFIYPAESVVQAPTVTYSDQKKLIDDIDANVAKDR